jgi:hypothetical protein
MIYSVYWGDERIAVVDAESQGAVNALISRHTCDTDECPHCAEFNFIEGVDGLSLKPLSITSSGYFRRGFWDTMFPHIFFPWAWVAILLWLFRVPQKPNSVAWPLHP